MYNYSGRVFCYRGNVKIAAYLSIKDRSAIVARAGVGTNAEHSFDLNGTLVKLRQVLSGFPHGKAGLLIGPGVLVDPEPDSYVKVI